MTYGIPPDELYDRLTVADLADLQSLYDAAPWGPEIDDLRYGNLAYLTYAANPFRELAKTPRDFMVGHVPAKPKDPEAVRESFKMWASGVSSHK